MSKSRQTRPIPENAARAASREEFVASLEQRAQAARSLQGDLLTKVPLLYGSPGPMEPRGDPGIVLVELHQEELKRKHGVFTTAKRKNKRLNLFELAFGWFVILQVLYFLSQFE